MVKSYSQDKTGAVPEWEMERHERYQKRLDYSMDSLRLVFRHRWSVGFSYGGIYMPGYTLAEKDYNTGIYMQDLHTVYMFSFEYYITNMTRIGLEAGWQKLSQTFEMGPDGASIRGGGGMNIPFLVYMKEDFNSGYRRKAKERLGKGQTINRPSFFLMAGVGFTSTNLVKIFASRDLLYLWQYNQTPFTSKLGIGLFQRVGAILGAELTASYQYSANYSPHIGSATSYSGFNLSARISVLGNAKFVKVRRWVNNAY